LEANEDKKVPHFPWVDGREETLSSKKSKKKWRSRGWTNAGNRPGARGRISGMMGEGDGGGGKCKNGNVLHREYVGEGERGEKAIGQV